MTDQRPFTCHVFIGTSLDGFIARTNGDLEWLTSRGEAAGEYGFQEFVDGIDTVAMGRVTYGNWLSLDPPIRDCGRCSSDAARARRAGARVA